MRNLRLQFIALGLLAALCVTSVAQEKAKLEKMQDELKDDVPHLLCVDENFATAGQPKDAAFAKLAANGYRSVLNLRTASEGVDLKHEQEALEESTRVGLTSPVLKKFAQEYIAAHKPSKPFSD